MTITIIVLSIVAMVSAAFALFFGAEMMKKFAFMQYFIKSSDQLVGWKSPAGIKPGMRKIVLRSTKGKSFSVLVGFHLKVFWMEGFDYYGHAVSSPHVVCPEGPRIFTGEERIVISTYVGRSSVLFQFLANRSVEGDITVSSTEDDQRLTPTIIYPPHWYQRLGFWA